MSWCGFARCAAGPSKQAANTLGSARQYATRPVRENRKFRDKDFRSSIGGFQAWANGDGKDYAYPIPGGRAKWLGGRVPFPLNPSFRPPPPLSNAVQDRIYTQLQQGDKDVATLASEYCISKARIHAIHKLKQVEAEFRRQSLPLQEAFQYGMEPLLDMKSPIDPSTRQYSERSAREEARARASDVSHQTEIVEETRWENGQGAEGSFGEPIQGLDNRRVEGLAWEWRDEETMGEIQPDRFTLPKRAQRERRDTSVVAPAQLLPAQGSKSAIRFIDMSKVGIPQEVQVARRLQSRAHQTSKRKARRDDVRRRASSPAPKSE